MFLSLLRWWNCLQQRNSRYDSPSLLLRNKRALGLSTSHRARSNQPPRGAPSHSQSCSLKWISFNMNTASPVRFWLSSKQLKTHLMKTSTDSPGWCFKACLTFERKWLRRSGCPRAPHSSQSLRRPLALPMAGRLLPVRWGKGAVTLPWEIQPACMTSAGWHVAADVGNAFSFWNKTCRI